MTPAELRRVALALDEVRMAHDQAAKADLQVLRAMRKAAKAGATYRDIAQAAGQSPSWVWKQVNR